MRRALLAALFLVSCARRAPDGAVLRQATFKALGITGRITSLVLDRSGGVILCDRRNDLLLRLN